MLAWAVPGAPRAEGPACSTVWSGSYARAGYLKTLVRRRARILRIGRRPALVARVAHSPCARARGWLKPWPPTPPAPAIPTARSTTKNAETRVQSSGFNRVRAGGRRTVLLPGHDAAPRGPWRGASTVERRLPGPVYAAAHHATGDPEKTCLVSWSARSRRSGVRGRLPAPVAVARRGSPGQAGSRGALEGGVGRAIRCPRPRR